MNAVSSFGAYQGQRVFVTGHTGFKGAWLTTWLHAIGAEVVGYAWAPVERGAFHDLGIASVAESVEADVRDADAVDAAIARIKPDLVFHLAAQPLVRRAWLDRRGTYSTNVMGTVNVLDAALSCESVKGVIAVTTDKVYENRETGQAYTETDRLGGHDPYSASKAAAELAVVPYRSSGLMGLHERPVVTVRAGNVIGGGDWSEDRLIPDIVRSLEKQEQIVLRRPDAVRPWQHVLDCVYGYLVVGAAMLDGKPLSDAYNFASRASAATVIEVTKSAVAAWGASEDVIRIERDETTREAGLLSLDPALAERELGWHPAWSLAESIVETMRFYRDPSIGVAQIEQYATATAKS